MKVRDHGPRVFTIDGVLTPAECESLVGATESRGYVDAPITTPFGFVMATEVRNNTRVMIDDYEQARWLWNRVEPWIPQERGGMAAVGLNERFRFYRYRAGQYFQWHRDGAFCRNRREISMLTLMVYLNEGFDGGDTEFEHRGPVRPRQGMVLVFDHGLRHRGAPVSAGTKYVMRTDVMYRSGVVPR